MVGISTQSIAQPFYMVDGSGNPVPTGPSGSQSVSLVRQSDGGEISTATAAADNQPTSHLGLVVNGRGHVYDDGSAVWRRQRGDTNGTVVQYALNSNRWAYAAPGGGLVNKTTADTIMAAAGVGIRNYIKSIQVDWDSFTAASEVVIRDGAGGTVLWRMKIPSGAAGMREVAFDVPLRSTANTLLEIATLTASGGGALFLNAQGYQGS